MLQRKRDVEGVNIGADRSESRAGRDEVSGAHWDRDGWSGDGAWGRTACRLDASTSADGADAENVMPQMMGTCFAQMSREQREYMLGHCRGLLDRMDEQCTVTGPTAPVSRPVGVA